MEEILDKMNYELVMSLTVEAPVSKQVLVFTLSLLVVSTWVEAGGKNNALLLIIPVVIRFPWELYLHCSSQLCFITGSFLRQH